MQENKGQRNSEYEHFLRSADEQTASPINFKREPFTILLFFVNVSIA